MMLATLQCDSLHAEAPVLYGSGTGGRMTRVGSNWCASHRGWLMASRAWR